MCTSWEMYFSAKVLFGVKLTLLDAVLFALDVHDEDEGREKEITLNTLR